MHEKKLRLLMIEKDIKGLELSRYLGITPSRLSLFLRGWEKMPSNLLCKAIEYCIQHKSVLSQRGHQK